MVRRAERKLPVRVICPKCHDPRFVTAQRAERQDFTGLCTRCARKHAVSSWFGHPGLFKKPSQFPPRAS